MIFNMVGGGGGSLKDTDAVLIVTVPTGSTVTATKSGTTLTPTMWVQSADNTLDTAIFSIPSSTFDANAWTVTATLGTDSASDTVVINSNEEYKLILQYERILFYNGTTDAELGSFISVSHATVGTEITTASNQTSGNYWVSNNSFVVPSKYTALNFEVSVSSVQASNYKPLIGLASSKLASGSFDTNKAKMKAYVTSGVTSGYVQLSLDITSYVGNSYYVGLVAIATTATRKIWLSE